MRNLLKVSVLCLAFGSLSDAGEIYEAFPENVNPAEKYVFYSHGFIVEGENFKPEHSRWGVYDFPALKSALADADYHLIAYHRPANADPYVYSKKLANDVRQLVEKGVDPESITIMGFSRGAFITGLASQELSDLEVNTVILAGCGRLVWKETDVKVYGHVLSVYEASDGAGTCRALSEKSKGSKSFAEIFISTGKEHGAFYTPLPEWVVPVKEWIRSRRSGPVQHVAQSAIQ